MTTQDHAPVTLASLIRDHQDRTGDSLGDIARAAGLSKTRIGQLAQTDPHHVPREETLEKLGRALHLPTTTIKRAALSSLGITPSADDADQRINLISLRLHELTPEALRHVEIFVNALALESTRDA